MTATLDRRGEAHLWLVFEEVLAGARASATGRETVDRARRTFANVAHALSAVGAIERTRAAAIVREFDDALAVRGLVQAVAFDGRAFPPFDPARHPVPRQGDGWFESEIEHHLDLIVDLDPDVHVGTGADVVRALAPVSRALQAVGSTRRGDGRLADLSATLAAAGYGTEADRGEVDRGWLGFLRTKPRRLRDLDVPEQMREVAKPLGVAAGVPIVLQNVEWSADLLDLEVYGAVSLRDNAGNVRCSAFDDRGVLHLGAGVSHVGYVEDRTTMRFKLRPGLGPGVRSLSVRVTVGAERLEEQVWL